MKSFIGTIMVLAVFGFALGSSALAQGGAGVANVEAGTETIEAAVSAPSAVPPPGPAFFTPAADEPSVGVVDKLVAASVAGEPATYINLMSGTPLRSSSKVLVIPNTEIKTEDLAAITQDLQVMAHIFHKIFTGPRLIEGIFEDYGDFFGRGSRATEAVYLQGYGVLFLMEVNIPLSSPPKAKETEKDENTQKADSVWNRAKQEIFHPAPTRNTRAFDSTEIYDAEKVEELKSRLIKALKHAANIRNIKPDEWIILTIIGKGGSYGGGGGGYGLSDLSDYYEPRAAVNIKSSYSSAGRGRYRTTRRAVPGGTGVASSTVLTIRAKKSDVDTFAKGELDFDKFREKVQTLTYPSWGQQVGNRYRIIHQLGQLAESPQELVVGPSESINKSLTDLTEDSRF